MSTRTDDGVDVNDAPEAGEPAPPDQPAPPGPGEPEGDNPDRADVRKIADRPGRAGRWSAGGWATLFLAFAYYPEWFARQQDPDRRSWPWSSGSAAPTSCSSSSTCSSRDCRGALSRGLMPYAFLLPAFGLIALMLLYPTIQTINYSFANADCHRVRRARELPDDLQRRGVPAGDLQQHPVAGHRAGGDGVLRRDRGGAGRQAVDQRREARARASSSCRWRSRSSVPRRSGRWSTPTTRRTSRPPACSTRSGALLGGDPQTWLQISTFRLNSFLLMVILIWLQVGFAMILLSSAIKGVPEDTLEAARIDGATEFQIFPRSSSRRSRGRSSRSSSPW